MTEIGLTDEDFRKIREAAQDDDHNMAYSLSDDPKRAGRYDAPVSERECALMRCMRAFGKSNGEIKSEIDTGHSSETIGKHTRGDCTCDNPVPPTICRSVGTRTEIDHEKTREKRREWRGDDKTDAGDAPQGLATDGGTQSELPPQSGSHYAEDTCGSDSTLSEWREPVSDPADAEVIERVCQSCGDIISRWEGEDVEELLTDAGDIRQGYADGCLSCGSSLGAWEFYEFVEVK